MRGDGGRQVGERVELLELTGPHDGQQTFDGAFTLFAPRPEHDCAPLNDAHFILPVSLTLGRSITPGTRWSDSTPIFYTKHRRGRDGPNLRDARWLASGCADLDARPGGLRHAERRSGSVLRRSPLRSSIAP